MKKAFKKSLVRNLIIIVILTVVNVLLVGLICIIGGWRSWSRFSDGFLYSAGLFFAIGAFSLMGNMNMKADDRYQYARTVGAENARNRTDNENESTESSYRFLLLMGITGAISIGLSVLIGKLTF
jgi:hypothetical protein